LIAGLLLMINHPTEINITATVVLVSLVGVFARYCWKWKPRKMRSVIEWNTVVWKHALRIKGQHTIDDVDS